ncbi:ComF family protein [Allopusillimonas soli]|nr:phosphoribosyltransferase family protein [Allopusillimonas soli]
MAYLSSLREWLGRAAAHGRCITPSLLAMHLPAPCCLCGVRTRRARLCADCRKCLADSMAGTTTRCARCGLGLAQGAACPDCSVREPAFDRVIAALDYVSPADMLVRRFKSADGVTYAPVLAALLAQAVRAQPSLAANTILVPVPASRSALARRGFNPAAELARYLSPLLGLPRRPGLVIRTGEGMRQASLPRCARMRNTTGLYRCIDRLDGRHIAVVDDVLTTGSTLHSICAELKAWGAASTCGLVLARTPYSNGTQHVSHHSG